MASKSEKTERIEDVIREGRDEMNVAEFPIALLSKRVPSGKKTLKFTKTIQKNGKATEQSWIVTGSDHAGLPHGGDEDVYVAMMEHSHDCGHPERVHFSRYGLLQRMGWEPTTENYHRLREALGRFQGVSIVSKNAFWDPSIQDYVPDVMFGIIDNVRLYDERKKRKASKNQQDLPFSYFTWNETFLRSLRAGNIKSLNNARYFRLQQRLSRRLFRYLDKKFGHKDFFQIDAHTLAHSHLGLALSIRYLSQIKREIVPALEELQDDRFLDRFEFVPSKSKKGHEILKVWRAWKEPGLAPDTKATVSQIGLLQNDPAAYFYQQLRGSVDQKKVTAADKKRAQEFIREYGPEVWQRFVDFAVRYRDSDWPDMNSLSGALGACWDKFHQQRAQQRERLKKLKSYEYREQWLDYLRRTLAKYYQSHPTEERLINNAFLADIYVQEALGDEKLARDFGDRLKQLQELELEELYLTTLVEACKAVKNLDDWLDQVIVV